MKAQKRPARSTPESPASVPKRQATGAQHKPVLRQISITAAVAAMAQRTQAGEKRVAQQQRAARLARGNPGDCPPPGSAAARRNRKRSAEESPDPPRGTSPDRQPPDGNNSPLPDASPKPSACTQQRHPGGQFVVATYNPMGGTTAESAIQSLAARQPDALILPELKISSRQQRRNLYRRLLGRHYVLTYSLLPGGSLLSNLGKGSRTKAGVLVAIARKHTTYNSLSKPEVPPPARLSEPCAAGTAGRTPAGHCWSVHAH